MLIIESVRLNHYEAYSQFCQDMVELIEVGHAAEEAALLSAGLIRKHRYDEGPLYKREKYCQRRDSGELVTRFFYNGKQVPQLLVPFFLTRERKRNNK